MTRHSTKCDDFSLAFFGFGGDFLGRDFEGLFRRDASVEHCWWQKQEISFPKKRKILRPREKRKHQSPSVVVKTNIFCPSSQSFCIHTHTEFLTLISHTMATFSAAKVRMQRNSFLLALVCCSRRRFPPAFSPDALFFSANHRKWMCA